MTDLEDFESWIYDKHCCIIIRRDSVLGECVACKIQREITAFRESKK